VEHWHTIMLRALGAIVVMFIFTRILGKRQISQLTFFEYITGITIGDLAGFISTDIQANYLHGLSAMLVWFVVPYTLERWMLKNRRLRITFEGNERMFIKKGKILEDNLRKERFTADELLEQLRTKNVFDLNEIEYAVLEASGSLSVLLKPEYRPLTPKHLQISVPREREPQAIIMDGDIIDDGLRNTGYTREWLHTELDKLGLTQENVFLAQVDSFGQIYVDVYDDSIDTPLPQVRSLLFANLKKIQADLELYAAATQDTSAAGIYTECAHKMDEVVQSLRLILTT
jgi:uncharacterized membrane protein YcaP (DUF421 family)